MLFILAIVLSIYGASNIRITDQRFRSVPGLIFGIVLGGLGIAAGIWDVILNGGNASWIGLAVATILTGIALVDRFFLSGKKRS